MTHSEIFWGWLVKQFAILGAVSIIHWIALALVTVLFGVAYAALTGPFEASASA